MCGRYASSRSRDELVIEFEVEVDRLDEHPDGAAGKGVRASYNIAPTDAVPVVLERPETDGPAESSRSSSRSSAPPSSAPPQTAAGAVPERPRTGPGTAAPPHRSVFDATDALVTAALAGTGGPDPAVPARPVRQLRALRWGLVPSWSKDPTGGARMINARLETLLQKGAFRQAALHRRCLVPADGWYEWQTSPTATNARGRPRKQPFFISPVHGRGLAFGGVYEFWRDRAAPPDDPTAWLVSFAVITLAAEPGLDTVHDRMPLVLPTDRWSAWLDPAVTDADSVHDLSTGLPSGRFAAVPVGLAVNSVRNDGPGLLEPAAPDSLEGVVDPATGELLDPGSGRLF